MRQGKGIVEKIYPKIKALFFNFHEICRFFGWQLCWWESQK